MRECADRDLSARAYSLRDQTVRQMNSPLLALLAAPSLILLACANIASLLLARGELYAGELAVQVALGGSASRVARLPLFQGFLVCCFGCRRGEKYSFEVDAGIYQARNINGSQMLQEPHTSHRQWHSEHIHRAANVSRPGAH